MYRKLEQQIINKYKNLNLKINEFLEEMGDEAHSSSMRSKEPRDLEDVDAMSGMSYESGMV